ncbi:hypothetical protein VB780_28340 [Leptolyngbya sp. CCNP1308]|uniref:hypothetical protein n=1 Tax=Leptolyngbya sp. CCNP1308 TaxID=3110255 RepID=UPI002B207A67|nr:hypothetical protein [Leptolyngbya sp. CCNP1308]MEA5452515.1 hypothetical protein [Leptolyngbya sp. CCNP1308]
MKHSLPWDGNGFPKAVVPVGSAKRPDFAMRLSQADAALCFELMRSLQIYVTPQLKSVPPSKPRRYLKPSQRPRK